MIYILGHSHALNPIHILSADPIAITHHNWVSGSSNLTFENLTAHAQIGISEPLKYLILNPQKDISAHYDFSTGEKRISMTVNYTEVIGEIENAKSTDLFCFIGGNEAPAICMVEDATPYDFLRPGDPPPATPEHQIIPYIVIHSQIHTHKFCMETKAMTHALRVKVPQSNIYIFAPPPPIPSNAHILANAEIFGADIKITKASIRLKYYQEYIKMLTQHCIAIDARLVPPPEGTTTPEGFLREEYWQGSTHGNMAYAERVVEQMREIAQ